MRTWVRTARRWVARAFGGAVLVALLVISQKNTLLFHAACEFASVVIAWGMFVFAWNSRRFIENGYLVFLGIAYLFVGILDFTHVLVYDGMKIVPAAVTGVSMRVWVVARYLEALSMLAAPLFLKRRVYVLWQFAGYALLVGVALLVVTGDGRIPDCIFSSDGVLSAITTHSVTISLIIVAAAGLLYRHRGAFAPHVYHLLLASLGLSVVSQIAFFVQGCAGTFGNAVGHLLKLVSYYLVFKAIIQTGLEKPYELLFRELKENEQKLQASNLAKDRFFSIMAHDLKDLFNVLFGYSEVLLTCYDQFSDDKKKAYVHSIRRSSEQVYRLLENLLYWSRARAGNLQPRIEPVSLRDTVEEARGFLRAIAEDKAVEVVNRVAPGVAAWADSNMLQVVIRNLLANAIKYCERGGHVHVSGWEAGDEVVLKVSDDGIGMPREQIERIFHAEAPDPPEGAHAGDAGTGLGLVLCREFVARNRGRLNIESGPGRGTEVTVILPLPPRDHTPSRDDRAE